MDSLIVEKPDPVKLKFSKFNYEGVLSIRFNQKLKLLTPSRRRNLIDMNQLAMVIFDFKDEKGDEHSNPVFNQINVLKWDELGLDVKFDFV